MRRSVLADVALEAATERLERLRALAEKRVATESQLVDAESQFATARLKLEQARLPVDEGKLLVLQQTLQLVVREHAVEQTELDSTRANARANWLPPNSNWRTCNGSGINRNFARRATDRDVAERLRSGDVVESGQPVARRRGSMRFPLWTSPSRAKTSAFSKKECR